jgi:preprotein translocase subunit YajC
MANPFELVILKLQELGFFTFLLPFILVAAILYGLLRKSQIFGPPERNVAINAVVAIVASFLVWASPIIAGINIEKELARFFVQSMIATLILMVAVLAAGMFFGPDLPKTIQEKLGAKYLGGLLIAGILIGFSLLVTSGLTSIFFPEGFEIFSEDVVISIATILILVIVIGVIVVFVSREEKKK